MGNPKGEQQVQRPWGGSSLAHLRDREEAAGLGQMGQRGEWKEEHEAGEGTGVDLSGPAGCGEASSHCVLCAEEVEDPAT